MLVRNETEILEDKEVVRSKICSLIFSKFSLHCDTDDENKLGNSSKLAEGNQ